MYRGLSGVNCALPALMFLRAAFDTATGRGVLSCSLPEGAAVVGLAHRAGLASGCPAAAFPH